MGRIVIVGGVAGGATAAARLARMGRADDVTILERGPDVSFANCGLPYFIGGAIKKREDLLLHTPQSLAKAIGVRDVRVNTEVVSIDRKNKFVTMKRADGGTEQLQYDKLILSPGAAPFVPPIKGVTSPNVFTLRNMQDMDRIAAYVNKSTCKRVAVIGAGFIGLEMAEQLHEIGKEVAVVERFPCVLPQADPEIAAFLHAPMRKRNIALHLGDSIVGIDASAKGTTHVALQSGSAVESDAVILSIGVRGDVRLAKEAGLEVSERGLVKVNDYLQTNDPDIYAVGDAVETRDAVFPDRRAWVALGNVANMQARVAADHIVNVPRPLPYSGSFGTSIVRVFDTTLALTGWTEARLRAAGIPYGTATINAGHHAGYYPGAQTMTLKITYEPTTGQLYGAQCVGGEGVDKRVDVFAAYVQMKATIFTVSQFQSSYSPPFGSAKDAVDLVCLAARNQIEGVSPTVNQMEGSDRVILDVRPKALRESEPLPSDIKVKEVIPIYFQDVDPSKLDPKKKYRTLCNWGRTAYFAQRRLLTAGLDCDVIAGGWRVESMRHEARSHGAKLPEYATPTPHQSKL